MSFGVASASELDVMSVLALRTAAGTADEDDMNGSRMKVVVDDLEGPHMHLADLEQDLPKVGVVVIGTAGAM